METAVVFHMALAVETEQNTHTAVPAKGAMGLNHPGEVALDKELDTTAQAARHSFVATDLHRAVPAVLTGTVLVVLVEVDTAALGSLLTQDIRDIRYPI